MADHFQSLNDALAQCRPNLSQDSIMPLSELRVKMGKNEKRGNHEKEKLDIQNNDLQTESLPSLKKCNADVGGFQVKGTDL